MARGSERSFKYNKRTKEDVRTRANMRGGNFDSFIKPEYKLYKVRTGKNLIRIMPPTWDDAKHYGYDIYVNYGIGADNQSYLSLAKMKAEKDPIDEARRVAEREGDKDLAKALRANQRILMWVIDRQDEDEGPQLWAAPFSVDKDIANVSFDEDTKEVVFVDDPEDGCDVRFTKEGEGVKTKYMGIKLLKASPLCDDEGQQDEWLEYVQANPAPDCLQFYDYEHIAGVYDGQVRGRDEEEEGEEKPKHHASREDEEDPEEKPQRRTPRSSTEDDEDPTPATRRGRAPAEEEEEPEEKPSRRRRVVEDEEPEEKPARGRSRIEKDEEEEPKEKPKPSLRDRIRARRQPAEDEE